MQKQILALLCLCSCSLMYSEPAQAGRFGRSSGGSHPHSAPHTAPHDAAEGRSVNIHPRIHNTDNSSENSESGEEQQEQANASVSDESNIHSGYVMLGLAGPLLFVIFRLRKFFRLRREKTDRESEFAEQMLMQHGRSPLAAGAGAAFAGSAPPLATPTPAPASTPALPRMADGGDIDAFIRQARASFLHLRTLNQAMNGEEIRNYLAPALVETLRPTLPKNAEAVKFPILKAELLESSQDNGRVFARLRFFGTVKLSASAPIFEFAEIWEFSKASAIDNWQVVDIIRETVA